MSIKAGLKNLVGRSVLFVTRHAEIELRDRHSVDLVLEAELRRSDTLSALHYPVVYVDILRSSIEAAPHSVREVKSESHSPGSRANRFSRLLDAFHGTMLPPVEICAAREIALAADRHSALTDSFDISHGSWTWAGDLGLHFSLSSSFGAKGRILYNIVRFMRSERCLELGTAYGMSAFFILAALEKYAKSGHLATIEGEKPQFSASSCMLKARFGASVSCHFGYTNNILPELFKSPDQFDFVFHDSTHSREEYIRDFDQLSQRLAPGSVVLFDDIRWESHKYLAEEPHTYKGWQAVVSHPRVRRAVEIDNTLGLLLFE